MSIPSGSSSNSATSANNTSTRNNTSGFNNPNNNKQNSTKQSVKQKSFTMMPSVTSRLKKNISRTKEKILQGIGKTDRTADESFDLYVENFEKQHAQAARLTKELNRYLTSLKETQKASNNFYDTLRETYEPNWPEHQEFANQVELIEYKWSDYVQKLTNDVQMPLISYLNEFPELKKKIEKRDNRLLDFDNARHTLEGVQSKTNKKHNSSTLKTSSDIGTPGTTTTSTSSTSTEQLTKLTKLKIDLEDKQHVYEEINQTLCMTLPVLFENRIKFYSSLFQTFFYTEATFHSDCVEVKSKLDTLCENLSTQTTQQISNSEELYYAKICQDQANSDGFVRSPELPGFTKVSLSSEETTAVEEVCQLPDSTHGSTYPTLPDSIDFIESTNSDTDTDRVYIDQVTVNPIKVSSSINGSSEIITETEHSKKGHESKKSSSPPSPPEYDATQLESIESFLDKSLKHLLADENEIIVVKKKNSIKSDTEEMIEVVGESSSELTKCVDDDDDIKMLYRVRAMYAYEAKEVDELTFGKDDMLSVVEGTESECEDLDEGWCIGIHEVSLKRGLFPANFTRKI